MAECMPGVADLHWAGGSARFKVELADTAQTRAKGLMFRESMPRFAGMLFIYERPVRAGFWMRNTPLPLDMLFFDQRGQMKTSHENAVPFDETVINGGQGIKYVLEINGGMISELGIKGRVTLRHSNIPDAIAALPCTKSN